MKNLKIVIALVFGSIIASCQSNTYSEVGEVVTNPTYVKNVAPIVNSNCISCHNGNQYPNLSNYDNVKEATLNGDVICRIDTQSCGNVMPQTGRMPQNTIDIVKLWAVNGYINQ